MKKVITSLTALAMTPVVSLGMLVGASTLAAPAAHAGSTPTTTTSVTTSTVQNLTVLDAKAKLMFKSKVIKKCRMAARKRERPTRPADPLANCKKMVNIKVSGRLVLPECPAGYYGTSGELAVEFRQRMRARAFAKTIVRGNASARARGWILDYVTIEGALEGRCFQVPVIPAPNPTYSCDQLDISKGAGRMVTINEFRITAQNGAAFQDAVIEWGDGATMTTGSPVGTSHTFAADGTYTIRATARFMVNGVLRTASGPNCTASVTFTPEPKPDSLTISGWSAWHMVKDGDALWNEVTAESNGATVGFSAPTVKSGPCAIVESSVVTHSATKKTQRIRVRPLTGQTGTCVITTRATAGSASEPWEGAIEIAPTPPGSWD